jgi:hypothetical protein
MRRVCRRENRSDARDEAPATSPTPTDNEARDDDTIEKTILAARWWARQNLVRLHPILK